MVAQRSAQASGLSRAAKSFLQARQPALQRRRQDRSELSNLYSSIHGGLRTSAVDIGKFFYKQFAIT